MMPNISPVIPKLIEFIGNKNIALLIGAFMAVLLLAKRKHLSMDQVCAVLTPPLETAGIMILITAAGGSFGLMLRNAGVGEAIKHYCGGAHFNMILLSYFIAMVIRVAQGSATVAMMTTAAIVYPMITAMGLPHDMLYIFLAIGWGVLAFSWMNDSGFWIVNRMSGMTEKETLKTWTVLLTMISFTGLGMTLLLSKFRPSANSSRSNRDFSAPNGAKNTAQGKRYRCAALGSRGAEHIKAPKGRHKIAALFFVAPLGLVNSVT